jgi:tRNA(Ile2) C34 agmatinyltransferase TiaS
MSSGLFSFLCPRCGSDLRLAGDGRHGCPTCGRRYTVLFGCLIPVDDAPTDGVIPRAAAPDDGSVSVAS